MKPPDHISYSDLKSFRKLTQKKFRELEKRFILEGVHLVEEALASAWQVGFVVVTEEFQQSKPFTEILGQARKRGAQVRSASMTELTELTDAVTPQGIVAVVTMPDRTADAMLSAGGSSSLLVALDAVSDPGNMGTILRTCAWFGVDAVLLGKNSVELYNPKVLRSTMGAIFHLPVYADVELKEVLPAAQRSGYTVVATAPDHAEELSVSSIPPKSVIVVGSEAHGVSRDLLQCSDKKIMIPRFGKAESLNAAVASAVILGLVRIRGRDSRLCL
jgi:TrmH family RNA methyltransferase